MENVLGDPVVKHDGFEGRAVVDFDGNDRMNTSYDLRGASEAYVWRLSGYSAFGVSRYKGGDNERVITSVGGIGCSGITATGSGVIISTVGLTRVLRRIRTFTFSKPFNLAALPVMIRPVPYGRMESKGPITGDPRMVRTIGGFSHRGLPSEQ